MYGQMRDYIIFTLQDKPQSKANNTTCAFSFHLGTHDKTDPVLGSKQINLIPGKSNGGSPEKLLVAFQENHHWTYRGSD